MINGFNLNLLSMQQICALPQYGGMPDQHIGGWCDARSNQQMGDWRLSFDISPASGANRLLANPRVMLACSYRCWCSRGRYHPSWDQPRVEPEISETEEHKAHAITIDVVSDFFEPWQDHLDPSPQETIDQGEIIDIALPLPEDAVGISDEMVSSTRLYTKPYPWTASSRHPGPNIESKAFYVAMNKDNRIQCWGDLPRFPFPGHYSQRDFQDLQSICAVQSSGGKG